MGTSLETLPVAWNQNEWTLLNSKEGMSRERRWMGFPNIEGLEIAVNMARFEEVRDRIDGYSKFASPQHFPRFYVTGSRSTNNTGT